ncbi:MAG: hypothetical protein AAB268_03840 [Elusimicrobiota bacterium]
MSYLPSGDGLTNFYWDDWALSGLLKRGGSTLTLGLAGGTGPRRLAVTDPLHRQTGVDLDTSSFQARGLNIEVVRADAIQYLKAGSLRFDTIWVDLYSPHGILPEVLSPMFLDLLRLRLEPGGIIFFHLFRPENRFYRYARALDPFESLFAALAASRKLQAGVFDHYASQTWALAEPNSLDFRGRLQAESSRLAEPDRRWAEGYMLTVLRRPKMSQTPAAVTTDSLISAFHSPVAGAALATCGLSPESGAADLDAWSEAPEELIVPGARATPANRLRWETMAMWLTGVGLKIPPRCRAHLEFVARRHADTGACEFERRRSLLLPAPPIESAACA